MGISMMTDDRSRFWIHRLDIIHQLSTVAVTTESIDGDYITIDTDHVGLTTIIDWNFSKTLLEASA